MAVRRDRAPIGTNDLKINTESEPSTEATMGLSAEHKNSGAAITP